MGAHATMAKALVGRDADTAMPRPPKPIVFDTPDGLVELQVEAYVVKGMNAAVILGNDSSSETAEDDALSRTPLDPPFLMMKDIPSE